MTCVSLVRFDARLHLLAHVEVFLFFLAGATLRKVGNPGKGSDIDIAMGTVGGTIESCVAPSGWVFNYISFACTNFL